MVRFEVVKSLLSSWMRDEEGASLVEYVLLVALIAVVCIAAVTLLGRAAKAQFTSATTQESPYTPVTVAMRVRGMLSICVYPRRSQGKPVILARASSTPTQMNGANSKARVGPTLEERATSAIRNPKSP